MEKPSDFCECTEMHKGYSQLAISDPRLTDDVLGRTFVHVTCKRPSWAIWDRSHKLCRECGQSFFSPVERVCRDCRNDPIVDDPYRHLEYLDWSTITRLSS